MMLGNKCFDLGFGGDGIWICCSSPYAMADANNQGVLEMREGSVAALNSAPLLTSTC